MYSAVDNGGYVGIRPDNTRVDLSTDDLPAIQRNVGYGDLVAQMLCDENPGIASIERVNSNSAFAGEVVTC